MLVYRKQYAKQQAYSSIAIEDAIMGIASRNRADDQLSML